MLNVVWTSTLVVLLSLTTIPCSTDPVQQGIAALERFRNITTVGVPRANPHSGEARAEQDAEEPAGPEPTTLFLVGAGLVGLAFSARRIRRGMAVGH